MRRKIFKPFPALIAALSVFGTLSSIDVLSQQPNKGSSQYTDAWVKDARSWRETWPENEKLMVVKVTDNIQMIHGVGGTTAVLTTADGALVVDTGHPRVMERRLFPTVKDIAGDNPVRYVINTHGHGDHAGGNAYYARQGAIVIAHDDTRNEIANPPPHYPPVVLEGLPAISFNDKMTLHFGGQTIELLHGPFGHSSGDVIVYFKEANVVHTGDIFIYHGYVSAAGMYKNPKGATLGLIQEQKMVLSLGDDNTKFITGHSRGIVSTRKDMERDHNVLVSIVEKIQDGIESGKSLDEIKATKPGKEFDDSYAWPGMLPGRTVELYYYGLVGAAPPSPRRIM